MKKGLTAGTKPLAAFRNIRVTLDGYQVVVVRNRIETSKFFAGHTRASLRKAEAYRDELLKALPSKRTNLIPSKVLSSLGLNTPVVGVFRHPKKQCYAVSYLTEDRRPGTQAFRFRSTADEIVAYADAIKFRKKTLRASLKTNRLAAR